MEYINDLIYNYKHFIIFILVTLIINIIIFLCVYNNIINTEVELDIKKEDIKDTIKTEETHSKINIDIKGNVKNPGVYNLEEGMLVKDAINVAGGLLPSSDTKYINLSKKLTNEMVIIIYSKEEIDKLSKGETTINNIETCKCPEIKNDSCITEETSNKPDNNKPDNKLVININTASLSELQNIPGIGEIKAKAIIEYRNKTKFKDIKEITNVTGIGESTFEKIKNYITV